MATTPRKYFQPKTQTAPYDAAKFNAQDAEALASGLLDHDTQLADLTEAVEALPANVDGVWDEASLPPISAQQQANLDGYFATYLASDAGKALLKSILNLS